MKRAANKARKPRRYNSHYGLFKSIKLQKAQLPRFFRPCIFAAPYKGEKAPVPTAVRTVIVAIKSCSVESMPGG
jgi:hypothetical protein